MAATWRTRIHAVLLLAALAFAMTEFVKARSLDGPLYKDPVAPHGIVSLQLAADAAAARAVLEAWGADGVERARARVASEWRLMTAGAVAIALLGLTGVGAARRRARPWLALTVVLLPLGAAAADWRENSHLDRQLRSFAASAAATQGVADTAAGTGSADFDAAVTGARVAAKTKFVVLLFASVLALVLFLGAVRVALAAASTAPGQPREQAPQGPRRFDDLIEQESAGFFVDPSRPAGPRPTTKLSEHSDEPRVHFRAADVIGLALSGGGIRSATFNLGLLQGLHRLNLLRLFDYVSTVSGGGYIGSFWSEWLARRQEEKTRARAVVAAHEAAGEADELPHGAVGTPPRASSAQPRTEETIPAKPDVARGLFPDRHDLEEWPPDLTDTDAERHLREFGGFLAPRLGFFEVETWTAVVAFVAGLLPALALAFAMIGLVLIGWLLLLSSLGTGGWRAPLAAILVMTAVPLVLLERAWRVVKAESAGTEAGGGDTSARSWRAWGPYAVQALVALAVVGLSQGVVAWSYDAPHGRHPVWLAVGVAAEERVEPARAGMSAPRYRTGWCDASSAAAFPACQDAAGPWSSGLWWRLIGVAGEGRRAGTWLFSPRLFDFGVAWLLASAILVFLRLGHTIMPRPLAHAQTWRLVWLPALDRVLMRLLGLGVLWCGLGLFWHLVMNLGSLISAMVAAVLSAGAFAAMRNWIGVTLAKPDRAGIVNRLKPYVPQALAYLTIVLAAAVTGRLLIEAFGSDWFAWWRGAAAMWGLLVVGLLIDPQRFGLHAFYRDRISRAYGGACNLAPGEQARHNRGTEPRERDDRPVTGLVERPLHLVCCAANDLSGDSLETLDRGARSAVVSRYGFSVGAWWCPPEEGLTLGAVVTASAAAFNSNMGQVSRRVGPAVSFLMTALNLRLGLWLRHPAAPAASARRWPGLLLYREMFGLTSASGALRDDGTPSLLMRDVHLSDGGHFENLALYELVRRHCRHILVSDCGADPDVAFGDLGNAIRRVREDFGVDISIDVEPLKPGADGRSRQHAVVGTIYYSPTDHGILVYVKPSLTGDEPPDLRQYKTRNAAFPHEGTADQFYDEAQWESYRRLGLHVAECIFDFVPPAAGARGPGEAAGSAPARGGRRVTADWVFAEAVGRLSVTPEGLLERALEMTRRVSDLDVELQTRPRRGLLAEVFPEVRWVAPGFDRAPASGDDLVDAGFFGNQDFRQVPQPFHQRTASDHASDLAVLLRVTQVLEDVWLACGLDRWWSHPVNVGWVNLFARWATAPTFRTWWPLLKPMFNPQFGRFLDERFPVPMVQPPADGDEGQPDDRPPTRVIPVDLHAEPGLAQVWWEQRSTQPRNWEGRALIQHLLPLRRPDGTVVEVQVGLIAVTVAPPYVGWTSDDYFVPPSLWGAGFGGRFLERLLDEFADFERCLVVVKAPRAEERHQLALDDRRHFVEQYRKVGFRQHLPTDEACPQLPWEVLAGREYHPGEDTLMALDLRLWRQRRARA